MAASSAHSLSVGDGQSLMSSDLNDPGRMILIRPSSQLYHCSSCREVPCHATVEMWQAWSRTL